MNLSNRVISFTLNGKRHSFSRSQVEAAVHNQTPRRIDKYQVSIGGILYPPKQVVERLLREDSIKFTTMDAQRILKKFGFEVEVGNQPEVVGPKKTISESYFEYYLRGNGYFDFEFEPELPGTSRRPDYRLSAANEQILIEVKQFEASSNESGFPGGDFRGGAYDPYAPIRQKIDDAREKFSDLKDEVCCLLLYNVNKPLVDLDWAMVYGAMLGNITLSVPFDPASREFDGAQTTNEFGRNGKCRPDRNTTISAVITLEPLLLGERRFQCHINKLKTESSSGKLSWEEIFKARDQARGSDRDPSIVQWGVVVHENPHARMPLSRKLFGGRFDQRYGDLSSTGSIQRIHAGEGILELEALEQAYAPVNRDFRELPTTKN